MSGTRSLALRCALAACVIGVIGASLVLFGLRAQLRHGFEQQVISSAGSVTALIQASTRAGMLHNRWDDVKEVIQNIDNQPGIVRIRLMDKKGEVVISSDESEVGKRLSVDADQCRACHQHGQPPPNLPREKRVRIFTDAEGRRVLGMIEPVPGGPECAGTCHRHPADQRVLGIIDTQLSLEETDRLNGQQTARLIGGALVIQLAASAGIALVVAWMLRRRLRPMLAAIARLGRGEYSARMNAHTKDEMGALGLAFNDMAGDLERTHEELSSWAHTLQDRVDEKTRELSAAQDQMVRSERLACLGRLAATVAHELNNPLAGVQVYARRARKALTVTDALPQQRANEVGGWMETVDREVGRCGRIVQDLLAFSRQRAPHRAPVDINEIVRRATRLLGHKLDLEEIDLALHLDESLGTVVADAGQVEQALLATMINAVEAMPKGGVLEIATRPYPGGGAEIEIKDTGTGIEPDVMPHIFEPFFTTKPEGQGTGLGLSVVYGIVTRHGGRLDISSAPGQGTRVTMVFPPTPAQDNETDDPAALSAAAPARGDEIDG